MGEKVNYVGKAVRGVKKTTTLHKICSKFRKHPKHIIKHHSDLNSRTLKHRCGVLYGYDEQYNKQSNKVADVIQNSHNSAASLKEQREKLIQEVNKLAKLSGPLPKLRLAG